jgi:diguanylate cyclase (GGDEF)-like protein
MKLPLRLRAFAWLTAAAAALAQLAWIKAWHGSTAVDLTLALVLVAFAAGAVQFQLMISPRVKFNVTMAFYFAIVLLFPAPVAIALVVGSRLLGEGLLALRRNPLTGRSRRDSTSLLFNNAIYALAAATAAAAIYAVIAQRPAAVGPAARLVWAVPAGAAAMYLVYSIGVATAAGVQLRQNPLRIWLAGRRKALVPELGLYPVGAAMAIGAVSFVWTPVLMIVPACVIFMTLRHSFRVQLVKQTVTAVEQLADIVDMRDHYTFEHSRRVADFAVRIAREMALPPEQVETIRLAARVHDLGKIGVNDHILQKPGKLTAEERAAVERHSRIGYQMLTGFPEYRHGADLVLYHHERTDGLGYPSGLQGDEIPVGAQVISVADAVDAMTSDRSYRSALTLAETLEELARGRGNHWAAPVVDAFQRMAQREGQSMVAAIEGARLAGLERSEYAALDAKRPLRDELARKLDLRPNTLQGIDTDVASAILNSLERMDERIQKLGEEATVDELTGVLRRRAGMLSLEREVAQAHRSITGALALAFIDVDGLKAINDSHGHAAGDELLRDVANALQGGLRNGDLVFRYGGDEFVCALPDTDATTAARRVVQIQSALSQKYGRDVLSAGLVILRDGETAEQMTARADGALYAERRIRRADRRADMADILTVIEGSLAASS